MNSSSTKRYASGCKGFQIIEQMITTSLLLMVVEPLQPQRCMYSLKENVSFINM